MKLQGLRAPEGWVATDEVERTLDVDDAVFALAQKFAFEAFSQLPLEVILKDLADTRGTSSKKLFRLVLEKILSEEQREFPDLKEKLGRLISTITERGAPQKTMKVSTFQSISAKAIPPFASFKEECGPEHRTKAFLDFLGERLFFEALEGQDFVRTLYDQLTSPELQHGYAGKKGSIINILIVHAASDDQEYSSNARKALKIIATIDNLIRAQHQNAPLLFAEVDCKDFAGIYR